MILALLLPLIFAQDSSLKVELPREVKAYGTDIELGEIATITGGTPLQLAAAKAFDLGYMPSPGFSRVLRSERVLTHFKRRFPEFKVSFSGESMTRVYPAVTKVSGAEIVAAAQAQLLAQYGGDKLSFQPRGNVANVTIPAGSVPHVITARLLKKPGRSGYVNVPVDLLVDGQRFRTVWTGWDAVVWETKQVLAADLAKGEVIEARHLSEQRVAVGLQDAKSLEQGLVPGSVANHDMLKGSLVKPADVKRPLVVRANDLILLTVQSGRIKVRTRAIVLSSGAVGDNIKVRTQKNQIPFNAKLISRDTCFVSLNKK